MSITSMNTRQGRSFETQAEKEYEDAKEIFETLNEQLVAELPQFLDLRVPYFDPSFEAMIRLQCKFAEEGYEKLGGVQRYFPDNVRDDYAAGQLDAQVCKFLFFESPVLIWFVSERWKMCCKK